MSRIDKNGNIEITPISTHLKSGAIKGDFKESKSTQSESHNHINLFGFLIIILVIISLAHFLRTGNLSDITFKGFIEFLSNAPSFDISWSMVDLTIYGDWGIFNFLREFFNWFTDIWEVCITLFGMIIESIEFIFYFVRGLLFS